ncbi:hypothetical protein LVJ83_07165 [Uruburuella testudinis]|uniref:Uncharacterized protein n=1 Tax=Uruburuella testudinis TaxID=1282863 RepID=A0ABY4DNY8_9NEIS|nr:hypothetical protein [Uruburuella testudinis]UOO80770.1 hypothetical protein LVJ83_07165 [Uruburuella testudinis]
MKPSQTHWFAKLLTSAIGLALVVMLTLFTASFFRYAFDFDIFKNYAALLMVSITLTVLAAPPLLSAYRKWTQRKPQHRHNKFAAHR